MRYAFAYGADAVYAGLPRYSLRTRNNSFDLPALAEGIEEAHAQQKKVYVTTNLLAHNTKVKSFINDMEPVVALNPDALIMADPGLIMLARERWPELTLHLSVQANTVNFAAVKFWYTQGIRRIILSRELSLEEIEEIRQQCPEMELEVFVHGALCIAYSGRCLLSGYFNHRDPNQGTCTNSCRWEYGIAPATTNAEGDLQVSTDWSGRPRDTRADEAYLLEERERPGEHMPIFEDEHGTYIMNSKDLRAVEHVGRLIDIGIDSIKIEGRTKSHYYVARTAQTYRQAIKDKVSGRGFNEHLLAVLDNLANRGYTDGFYKRHHTKEYQNYIYNASKSHQQNFVGEAMGAQEENGLVTVDVKNRFAVGDELEFISPEGNVTGVLESMQDKNGNPIQLAPGSGHQVRIHWPQKIGPLGLLARNHE